MYPRVFLFMLQVVTGLKINREKCEIIGMNIDEMHRDQLQSISNVPWTSLPIKYLGLPSLTKAQSLRTGSVWCTSWSVNSKVVKVRCYLQVVGGFFSGQYCEAFLYIFLSILNVLEGICNKFESIRAKFFWHGTNERRGLHLIKWDHGTMFAQQRKEWVLCLWRPSMPLYCLNQGRLGYRLGVGVVKFKTRPIQLGHKLICKY